MNRLQKDVTLNPHSRLVSRIAVAYIHIPVVASTTDANGNGNPIYTQGPFPAIHISYPTTPLNNIKATQIKEWEDTLTAKFLAIPFDIDMSDPSTYSTTTARIMQVVRDVTQQETISITTPIRSADAVLHHTHPSTFFVFNLMEEATKMMTDNEIWSTDGISFRVIPLDLALPFLLFLLGSFTTMEMTQVLHDVQDHWTS